MGTTYSLLTYDHGGAPMVFGAEPQIDVAATDQMVDSLFTGARFVEESDLGGHACPDPWMVGAAVFAAGTPDEVAVLASEEVALDRPSELDQTFLVAARGRTTRLFTMSSRAAFGAFAAWDATGTLQRAVSACGADGILEDLGAPLAFEDTGPDKGEESATRRDFLDPVGLVERALATTVGFAYGRENNCSAVSPGDIPIRLYRVGELRTGMRG
ncbi:DUF6928 family protein [Gordonia paraffinivorans]|uniref:Uncharacterized protein n=2 Tax=Gordonia paraffinivorans TaxID=175628 RepID=A0ABQ0IME2_9ACTN|nr:hypothetical protein [Gordonia paraffinivorans]GAC84573.1 hypothetical protein GP2_023_00980 [Gordonia paraffinivorans NBRC 108238]VFA89912.1 Uncharacterised protein [Gordonia paraffinivorans]